MQNNIPKYLVETDILVDFLTVPGNEESHLMKLMQKGICFTSVINASELFFYSTSVFEKQMVRDLLNSINVLGLHSRYSLSIPECSDKFNNVRDALFYILAKFNNLTIISVNPDKYGGLKVQSIHPDFIK